MSALRAVLFDLGNTLVDYYPGSEFPAVLRLCVGNALEAVGLTPTEARIEEAIELAEPLRREREDHAVLPLERRLRAIFEGLDARAADRIALAARAFLEPIFRRARPNPAALTVLAELRAQGLGLAIVSNTPWGSPAGAWREELERLGLLARVDAAVFCVDVGWRKPHPAPFLEALRRLAVEPGGALFVGDDPRWDVAGAQGIGMRPVLLDPGSLGRPKPVGSGDSWTTISRLEEVLDVVASLRR